MRKVTNKVEVSSFNSKCVLRVVGMIRHCIDLTDDVEDFVFLVRHIVYTESNKTANMEVRQSSEHILVYDILSSSRARHTTTGTKYQKAQSSNPQYYFLVI